MNDVAEKCPRIEGLSALIDDELEPADRAALDAHVAGCAICAPVLADFRQLRARFAALPEAAPGADLAALVDRRIGLASAPKPRQRPRRRSWWRLAPAALGGALSLTLGAYFGSALMLGAPITAPPAALQMAAFAAMPPGALCPGVQACSPMGR